MSWQSAALSNQQNPVEPCLGNRANESRFFPGAVDSGSSALISNAAKRVQVKRHSGVPNVFAGIVGASRTLKETLNLVRKVAPTNSTALIEGETGTGKELIARAIHTLSARRDGPFVKLNCAAIPLALLESELFGHERGAFTGALARKAGRFEAACRGTLFLDEIGDIPLEMQSKLLRVLQEGEFERLGSVQSLRADVRLVAATNHDLAALVSSKRFRSDLYYRLNVFPILIPPLRDRAGDIPILVSHFVKTFADRMGKQIHEVPIEVMEALVSYPWPGNIRELQHFIERSVILTSGNVLCPPLGGLKCVFEAQSGAAITLREAERDHIRGALDHTRWVIGGPNGAAARLGIKRSTLYFRMQRLGISRSGKEHPPIDFLVGGNMAVGPGDQLTDLTKVNSH
jgi:formate hydrogenlyase transcriptional activator